MKILKRIGHGIATGFATFVRLVGPAGRIALRVAERVGPDLIAHPRWTDEQRRKAIIAATKDEVAENHPRFAWIVAVALDIAVNSARAQLRRV